MPMTPSHDMYAQGVQGQREETRTSSAWLSVAFVAELLILYAGGHSWWSSTDTSVYHRSLDN